MARVFALVVRCRIMRLVLYSRVDKNRDTRREPPAVPGRAVPPATKRSSLARRFSRYGKAIAYTDLLQCVFYLSFYRLEHFINWIKELIDAIFSKIEQVFIITFLSPVIKLYK